MPQFQGSLGPLTEMKPTGSSPGQKTGSAPATATTAPTNNGLVWRSQGRRATDREPEYDGGMEMLGGALVAFVGLAIAAGFAGLWWGGVL